MGWATGSYMAQDIWDEIRDDLKPEKREKLARRIIQFFSNEDADAWDYSHRIFKDAGVFEKKGMLVDKNGKGIDPYHFTLVDPE